jgi:hypothetical protein
MERFERGFGSNEDHRVTVPRLHIDNDYQRQVMDANC